MAPETLTANAEKLTIRWPDGESSQFGATELRAAARDAASQRQLYDTGKIEIFEDLKITACDYVGAYGINVCFSDGHDRAIYPFKYLRELSGLTTS